MKATERKPEVYKLYENPIKPEDIERMSFEAIERETVGHGFADDEWVVVKRMLHTTADFSFMGNIKFSPDAIDSATKALLRGAHIYADSNMIKSGVSEARLKSACENYTKNKILCHIADADVVDECKSAGLPRSLFAIRKAKAFLDGAIVLIGNAPVALMELNRIIVEENVKPAVVIGVPVGFIHVVESKEELMQNEIPYITITGRRGGSTLAVSAIHSLCAIASASALKG
ncbi:Cobalt-precorrin-8 methylmutase [hydrothermal vent metagenome]|uniref:Cobalt-precorrin-8 methylmutase n=1 Tax=hydrothermal vent metagenome TaxID=652676 RepID=A0A3B1BUQ2_9ZZZZ